MPRSVPLATVALAVGAATVALLGATVAAPRPAVAAAKASRGNDAPHIDFTQYTLANGLRVILAPDKRKDAPPVIAVNVTYNVGSRNERPGRSGFAHLFEHMMFQGSANVAKTEHILLVQSNGGSMNGTTNQDRTNFFETLPANQLELALFLEADRMSSLDISKENLENQRQVVEEEKRQSYDNRPYGHSYEALLDEAYGAFPYKHTTIGSMSDLDAATLADVTDFHHTYYEPNNAVLTVTGRFDDKQVRTLIDKYFGPITPGAAPPPVNFTEPTLSMVEKRKTISDPLARQTQYIAGYKTVSGNDPDFYPLVVLGDILGGGRTSRLTKALVEPNIATSANASQEEQLGPALFTVSITLPADGGDLKKAESVMEAQIARIQETGVTEDELTIARAGNKVRAIRGLETALGRASRLGLYAVIFNDPNRINEYLPHIEAVTAADVQRVAKKYLVTPNRAVVITEPSGDDPFGGAQ
jgi:predicted Zn-dependent peptidase